MKCIYCDCQDTRVIDSRDNERLDAVRRRRQCIACGKRFTTYERAGAPLLQVMKRDGRVEDFERDKLEVGILKACEKRPIARSALDGLIDDVEDQLRAAGQTPVQSSRVGELVLDGLKRLDEVAYLRFASVYKEFTDARHFQQEAASLLAKKVSGTPQEKVVEERHGRRG